MKTTIIVILTLTLAVGLTAGYFIAAALNQPVDPNAGSTGITHRQTESFVQGLYGGSLRQLQIGPTGDLVEGGDYRSANTSTALTGSQLCNLAFFEASNTSANATFTLPTAASLINACFTANGAFTRFFVKNSGTSTVAVATSTGDTISKGVSASSTTSFSSSTYPWGSITAIRVNSTTVNFFVGQFQAGL